MRPRLLLIINRKSHIVDLLQISSLEAFIHALLLRAYLCSARLSCMSRAQPSVAAVPIVLDRKVSLLYLSSKRRHQICCKLPAHFPNQCPEQNCGENLVTQNNSIIEHLLTNKLTSAQHVFLSRRSTTSNLLQSSNDWTLNVVFRLQTGVVYIGFAKTFDTVSQNKLFVKLHSYGIYVMATKMSHRPHSPNTNKLRSL